MSAILTDNDTPMQNLPATPSRSDTHALVAYSPDILETICERLARGESLAKICQDDGMPAMSTVLGWVNGYRLSTITEEERSAIRNRYMRAREDQANRYGELVTETAEQALEPGKNSNEIQGLRLAVDAYKWTAERLAPRRYGNKQEITGPDGGPLQVQVVTYTLPAK